MGAINYDLKKIRAVVLDIDGVISPQSVYIGENGNPLRMINVKDGYAIQLAVKHDIVVAVISGGKSNAMAKRLGALGVTDIIMSAAVKADYFQLVLDKHQLSPEQVLYMGDDIPDYDIMRLCGLPCCPHDAATDIKGISKYISQLNGGEGCVRDVLEQVLRAQGKWMTEEAFKW